MIKILSLGMSKKDQVQTNTSTPENSDQETSTGAAQNQQQQEETGSPKAEEAPEIQEEQERASDQAEESSEAPKEEENPLENLEKENQNLKEKHLRLFAEFENYKKRTARERVELYGTANQELMGALLPVLDDFKRAMANMEEGEALDGVKLIYNKFENTLKQKGLEPMESCKGKDFDVDTMEAITRIPAPEDDLKGKVVDEIEGGYYLGNKILRYAKVVVGE